jgi:hypothetical protein
MQVRCAVVALWSEQEAEYAPLIWLATAKLDSFLPTYVGLSKPVPFRDPARNGWPFGAAAANLP